MPFQFGTPQALEPVLQGHDGWRNLMRLEPLDQLRNFLFDDSFGLFGLALALLEIGIGDMLQVVNVVDKDVVDRIDRRIDVAARQYRSGRSAAACGLRSFPLPPVS